METIDNNDNSEYDIFNYVPRPTGRPRKYTEEELKELKRELSRKHYQENKEQARIYKRFYYEENRDRLLKISQIKRDQYKILYPDDIKPRGRPKTKDSAEQYENLKLKARQYYHDHKEEIREKKKLYYQEKKERQKANSN
jgi:hypothetical protein